MQAICMLQLRKSKIKNAQHFCTLGFWNLVIPQINFLWMTIICLRVFLLLEAQLKAAENKNSHFNFKITGTAST